MTIVQPPTYIAAGCYTAQQFRALQDSAAGHQPNVVTGLTLTTVSGRDLTFSAGSAVVEGATVAEGYYQVLVSAPETVTVGVGNPTNPRIDRIVVRVKTTEFGDATSTGSIEVVAGTPASSPVAPTPSFSRYLTLATVYVAAGATTLTSANVTQLQINNRNVSICTSAGRPSAPTKGQPIYETDTNKLLQYQTATTGWTPPWNLPWGRLFAGYNTTGNVPVSAGGSVYLLSSPSLSLPANRRYRLYSQRGFNSNETGYNYFAIDELSPISVQLSVATARHTYGSVDYTSVSCESLFETTVAGNYSFGTRFQTQTTGVIDVVSTWMIFTIDDVGPTGPPL